MAGMKPPAKEETRDRVLTDDELKIIWKHSDYYPFGYMLRLLMLTGQRRGEIGQLKWSYIGESAITLPKEITKNGRAHTFQIGPMTKEILKAIPKITDYVFPNREHSSCFKGYSSAKVHFDNRCPIKEAWSIHDLRRTLATGWQRAGIAITVTEKHLNHVAGSTKGIIGIYQRYSYEPELIEAVEQWDIRLQGLIQ
jgi:integrase